MKTGALLRFGCIAGAILGQCRRRKNSSALDRYGRALGEAFQIADDLLDVEGDAATLGKATGKDAAAGKATLVGVLGPAAARSGAWSAGGGGAGRALAVWQCGRCAQGRGPLCRDPQHIKAIERRSAGGMRRPVGRTTVPWPLMVQLGGLEPPTSGSTDRRSNQLSYSCTRYRRAVRDRRHPRIGGKL